LSLDVCNSDYLIFEANSSTCGPTPNTSDADNILSRARKLSKPVIKYNYSQNESAIGFDVYSVKTRQYLYCGTLCVWTHNSGCLDRLSIMCCLKHSGRQAGRLYMNSRWTERVSTNREDDISMTLSTTSFLSPNSITSICCGLVDLLYNKSTKKLSDFFDAAFVCYNFAEFVCWTIRMLHETQCAWICV